MELYYDFWQNSQKQQAAENQEITVVELSPAEAVQELSIDDTASVAICVAVMREKKGHLPLLDAMLPVFKAQKNLHGNAGYNTLKIIIEAKKGSPPL